MCPSIHVEASHTPSDQTNLSHVARIAPNCDLMHAKKKRGGFVESPLQATWGDIGQQPIEPYDPRLPQGGTSCVWECG